MITGSVLLASLLLAADAAAPDVTHLGDRRLEIPITIDPARRNDVSRMELFVSTNEGKSWPDHEQSVTSEATAFNYVAPQDGLYYLCVLMTDKAGKTDPPSPFQAEQVLKVYVDTVKPQAQLVSAVREGDEVVVQWKYQEQFPSVVKSRLEYRTLDMPANTWNPVPSSEFNLTQLQARFRPGNAYAMQVRLHVEDLARNAVDTNVLEVAGNTPPPLAASLGGGAPQPAPLPAPTPPGPQPTTDQVTQKPPREKDNPWSPNAGTPPAPLPQQGFAASQPGIPLSTGSGIPTPTSRQALASTSKGGENLIRPASNSTPAGPRPGSRPQAPGLPAITYTNAPQALVEYRVGNVGLSGATHVRVFITDNDGQNWTEWPHARKVGEPVPVDGAKGRETFKYTLQVDLPGEGVYGLYLVVVSGVGKHKELPKGGEPPMIRYEVDTTPPQADLWPPDIVLDKKNAVLLSWDAKDRNLTENPIALEWAENPNGPWEGIGPPELPNSSGRYTWEVPPSVPPQVYLRLRVRDKAGNVNVAQTERLVDIDLNTPQVEIVEPGKAEQGGGAVPQVVPGSIAPATPPAAPPITPATFRQVPPR